MKKISQKKQDGRADLRASFVKLAVLIACTFSCEFLHALGQKDILFYASFDKELDADFALGEKKGAANGDARFVDGKKGKGLIIGPAFTADYSIDKNLIAAQGSIEFWIKPVDWTPTDSAPTFKYFFRTDRGQEESGSMYFQIYKYFNTNFIFFMAGDLKARYEEKRSGEALLKNWMKGDWYHLVFTWDSTNFQIFQNGLRINNRVVKTGAGNRVPVLGKAFHLGGGNQPVSGESVIDELKIYQRPLNLEEVSFLFAEANGTSGVKTSVDASTFITIPATKTPPQVDGVLGAPEWADASTTEGFLEFTPGGKFPPTLFPNKNKVHMKYDAQFLYLGLVSAGVPGATLIANERLRDGKIYADDCFEILIAPHVAKGEKETVYKIDVNSLGVFCDSKRFDAAAWNAQITASAKVENDIFQAELRIPWSDLGTSSDSSKEIAINIIRSFKGTPRPIYAGLCASEKFLDPDSYARVSLAGEGDGLQVQYFDALQSGSIRTVSQLNNITLGHSQSLTLKKGSETILNDSSTARFGIDNFGKAVVEMAFPKSERKFTLDMEIKDVPGRILFRRQVPFAANENLGIELDIISQKQLVVVRANTFGLTDLKEGSYDLVYQIFKKGETSPLISEALSAPTKGLHNRDLSIAKLGDGPHEARISIVDKKGAQLLSKSKDFQIFKNPPWLGNTLGITDKVPAPWVPVIFRKDGSTVEVWGRTYRFAKSPFPEETAVLGERIFSRPAVLFVKFPGENEGTAVSFGPLKLEKSTEMECTFTRVASSRDFTISSKTTVEFDGCVRWDWEYKKKGSRHPDKVWLEISFDKKIARFFHASGGGWDDTDIFSVSDFEKKDWSKRWILQATLGDLSRGLSVFCDTERDWDLGEKEKGYQLSVEPDAVKLQISPISRGKGDWEKVNYTFGFSAYPVRPTPRMSRAWRIPGYALPGNLLMVFTPNFATGNYEDGIKKGSYRWAFLPYGNFPRGPETDSDLIPKTLEQYSIPGKKWIAPYFSPTHSSYVIPEWAYFQNEWTSIPKSDFPEFAEPRAQPANKKWMECFLWNFNDYVKKYRINGWYSDLTKPHLDMNEANGLGFIRDGRRIPEFNLWATRETFKRTYVLHRSLFPDGVILHHMSKVWMPSINCFSDVVIDGEQYGNELLSGWYLKARSLDTFAWEQSAQFGPGRMNLPALGQQFNHTGKLEKMKFLISELPPTLHLLGLLLLHDVNIWPAWINGEAFRNVYRFTDQFGLGEKEMPDQWADCFPYTRPHSGVLVSDPAVKVTLYKGSKGLLAIVMNTDVDSAKKITLSIDHSAFGLASAKAILFDPLLKTETEIDSGKAYQMDLNKGIFKMLWIKP